MTADAHPTGEYWQCVRCGALHRHGGGDRLGPRPSECMRERGGCGRTTDPDEEGGGTMFARVRLHEGGRLEMLEDVDVHIGPIRVPGRTDLSNAARFVERARDVVLWCDQWRKWLAWTGYKWEPDAVRFVNERAKVVVCEMFGEAFDSDEKKDLSHATASASSAKIAAMLELAKSALAVRADDLDRPRHLLNAPNCTFDFDKRGARENLPGDLLTRSTGAGYYGAVAPGDRRAKWTAALKTWFRDDDLSDYVKRLVGYTLLGTAGERLIVFAVGPTSTGKTAFVETVAGVLGDYATTLNVENLYANKNVDGKRADPELADLQGVRFVKTSEVRQVARFDIARVKALTASGGVMKARRPYGDTFQFERRFTIWVDTNVLPRVDDDDAFWARVRIVPFDFAIPDADKRPNYHLELIETEGAGILGWAVEGALEYLRDGLGHAPYRCVAGKEAFKREASGYAAWFEECCERREYAWTLTEDLHKDFDGWARENGRVDLHHRGLAAWLKGGGFTPDQRRAGRGWMGVILKGQYTFFEGSSPDVTGNVSTSPMPPHVGDVEGYASTCGDDERDGDVK